MKKIYNLALACGKNELRPAMKHVLIDKEKDVAVGCDGFMVVYAPLMDMFSAEVIEHLQHEDLIHSEDWVLMSKANSVAIKGADMLQLMHKKGRDKFIQIIRKDSNDWKKYPNWFSVIPNVDNFAVHRMKIDFRKGAIIQKIMETQFLDLYFTGTSKGIKVSNIENNVKALLMPGRFDN